MPGKQSALTSALSKGRTTQVNSGAQAPAGSAAAALACKKIDSCPRESFPCLYVHENDREPLDAEKFDDEERTVPNDPAARFLAHGADEVSPLLISPRCQAVALPWTVSSFGDHTWPTLRSLSCAEQEISQFFTAAV